jgi:hypothetical protein
VSNNNQPIKRLGTPPSDKKTIKKTKKKKKKSKKISDFTNFGFGNDDE